MAEAIKRVLVWFAMLLFCLFFWVAMIRGCANAEPVRVMTASWYSIESLKKEGTYKYSKGVMANGRIFNNDYTCATNLYPLGSILRVYNLKDKDKKIEVEVTDRINKRFTKTRIDLSQKAFSKIDDLNKGIVKVEVEYMGNGWF
jgi:rare lipoprotein A (peptidoglycan hydrolase)